MDELLEVIVYDWPGVHRFDPADHPDATHMRIIAQGGRGGRAADGTPGHPGQVLDTGLIPVKAKTSTLTAGEPGQGGGQPGETALILIELYRRT